MEVKITQHHINEQEVIMEIDKKELTKMFDEHKKVYGEYAVETIEEYVAYIIGTNGETDKECEVVEQYNEEIDKNYPFPDQTTEFKVRLYDE